MRGLAMVLVKGGHNDCAAYWGISGNEPSIPVESSVLQRIEEMHYEWIAEKGNKMSEKEARAFFFIPSNLQYRA